MVEKTYNINVSDSHLLVFDLDGTVVDTDIVNYFSYKKAIQRIIGLDLQIANSKNERFTREHLFSVIENLTDLQYENIVKMKNGLYQEYVPMSKLNTNIVSVIQKYINTNKIVLATNSHKCRAEMVLHHHRLENFFDYVFFKENYSQENKYLHVLNFLGASANSMLVFENDDNEIRKAVESGIPSENIMKVGEGKKYE